MAKFILKTVSSIEKVLRYEEPKTIEKNGVCFKNARYNFQLVGYSTDRLRETKIKVESDIIDYITIRVVDDVAVQYTYNYDVLFDDDFCLTKKSMMLPDLLRPYEVYDLMYHPDQWTSTWVTVVAKDGYLPVGDHKITFTVYNTDGELGKIDYELCVIDKILPSLDIFNINWMHYDCLSEWYGLEIFSQDYYKMLNEYVKNAVNHGINTLFVPLFTPPLDTEVGSERPTAQLVGVTLKNGEYSFDFTMLDYFIKNGLKLGMEKIEFSHLYTQWGGTKCPKIMAQTENGYEKIFGWETDSEGVEYVKFIETFLPKLVQYVYDNGYQDICYFHIFDEPQEKDLEKYSSLRKRVKSLIGDLPVIDALSDERYAEMVDIPVSDISCVKHFLGKCENYGIYYFCGTSKNAPNRFIVHPALRTRMLGYIAYKLGVKGFLHWGFNFWKTELSRKNINPFLVNDAGGAFPAGDAFTVYPGDNAPLDSIRNEILSDCWCDYKALLLAEKKVGRNGVLAVLDKYGVKNVNEYSLNNEDYLSIRQEIIEIIQK